MAVDNEALLDLVATTLKDLPKGEFEVMWTHQNYVAARIYNKSRRQIDGGTSIERNVVFDHSGNARYRRLFDTDQPNVSNVHHKINVPWAQVGTHYSWDVLEILRNKNSTKGYINLMKTRRMDGLWALADLIEERMWKSPESATDTLNPYGVPYYLNMADAGATAGGFVGKTIRYQDASTGTICAGIDANTQAKWRNYADIYAKVDNALLRKMRKAFLLGKFAPPSNVPAPGQDTPGSATEIYVNSDVAVEMMDLADKRDDNNTSSDLAGKVLVNNPNGITMFNRRPVVYVSALDGVNFAPIYCVDWSKIIPLVQDGYWMVESKPMSSRGQHTTITVFNDSCHQNLCINRKTAGFVMHTAIPG